MISQLLLIPRWFVAYVNHERSAFKWQVYKHVIFSPKKVHRPLNSIHGPLGGSLGPRWRTPDLEGSKTSEMFKDCAKEDGKYQGRWWEGKGISLSLILKDIQSNPFITDLFIRQLSSFRLEKINTQCWWECCETGTLVHYWLQG